MEAIAIVGSRQGADLDHVRAFVAALWQKQPASLLVSGGAEGVDITAEHEWIRHGGRVLSLRPIKRGDQTYSVQRWEYGGTERASIFIDAGDPDFTDYAGACLYRDMLIAERCDRLVAFFRKGRSRGTAYTVECAREAHEKPVYEFEAAA